MASPRVVVVEAAACVFIAAFAIYQDVLARGFSICWRRDTSAHDYATGRGRVKAVTSTRREGGGARQRAVTSCSTERARDLDSPRPLGLGDPTCRRKSGAPAIVAVGTGRELPVSILRGRRQRQRQHNDLLDRIYDACLHSPDQQTVSPQSCDSRGKKWAIRSARKGRENFREGCRR